MKRNVRNFITFTGTCMLSSSIVSGGAVLRELSALKVSINNVLVD